MFSSFKPNYRFFLKIFPNLKKHRGICPVWLWTEPKCGTRLDLFAKVKEHKWFNYMEFDI